MHFKEKYLQASQKYFLGGVWTHDLSVSKSSATALVVGFIQSKVSITSTRTLRLFSFNFNITYSRKQFLCLRLLSLAPRSVLGCKFFIYANV